MMETKIYKVIKKYYLEGQTIVTITNQSRKSCNTMTESEIDEMKQAWVDEGCRIISGGDYEV